MRSARDRMDEKKLNQEKENRKQRVDLQKLWPVVCIERSQVPGKGYERCVVLNLVSGERAVVFASNPRQHDDDREDMILNAGRQNMWRAQHKTETALFMAARMFGAGWIKVTMPTLL